MTWGTVALPEVIWVAICLWGAWHHGRVWAAIQHDIIRLVDGEQAVTPGALALFRNDAESELDWTLLKSALVLIGMVRMTQPNPPLDLQAWISVVVLLGIVVWTRLRSEVRGRRRQRIVSGHESDASRE